MEKQNIKSIDKDKYSSEKILKITTICMFFIFFCFFIYFLAGILSGNITDDIFGDFAETLSFCFIKNPYSGKYEATSIYPPIAFLCLYPFALICKPELLKMISGEIERGQISYKPSFLISYILYFTICFVIISILIAKISKFKGKKLFYLLCCIFMFSPMLFCLIRGNNVLVVCVFVLLFFYLKDSEKRYKRELANLCISIAITIKIYPALILLIFIKERRWKDILMTGIYTILFAILPMFLIEEGLYNLKYILSNVFTFSSQNSRLNQLTNISLDALLYKICYLFGLPDLFFNITSKILRYGILCFGLIMAFLSKENENKITTTLLVFLTYYFFSSITYSYHLIYLILPITYYFMDFENIDTINKLYYGMCFILIALPIWWAMYNFIIPQIALIALLVKVYFDIISEYKRNKHNNKPKKESSYCNSNI